MRAVAVEKISAPAYLDAVFAAWESGVVVVPTDDVAGLSLPGVEIVDRIRVAPGGGWFAGRFVPDDSPAPAQISFTSGTTGTPKPILLSRRALSDVVRRLIDVMAMDASIREYVGVPVTFSFGLGRARAIAAVGGRAYLPPHGFRPDELADMLARGEVNALSAVPTLLRVLIGQAELFAGIGDRLRWLEIGSQHMSAEEKLAVRRLFPKARIVQHYGLTEASRTTFLVISEAEGRALASVGRPTGDAALRLDDQGRICVRGPHVADGIVTADGVVPLADGAGWLTTSDLGTVDADGHVHFGGRADHLLNVSGIKVPAELFEQRLIAEWEGDARAIAVAARSDPLRGEAVMVAHLPGVPTRPLGDAARRVAAGFGLGAGDIALVEVPEIPRTDTGKVQRGVLTDRHGQAPAAVDRAIAAAADGKPDGTMSPREREIAAIWEDALGIAPIGRDENFFDLGGDSLSAITVMLRMERAGVPKSLTQQVFEGRTIAEIAANEAGGGAAAPVLRAETSDAINMTRGILVLIVIAAHWAPFLLIRAGGLTEFLVHWTNPLFRSGTPSFAIVFGLGLGYFYTPIARKNPGRLGAKLRLNTIVVGSAVLFLGAIHGLDALITGDGLGPDWPVALFYEVLLFYLLMVASAGLVLRIVLKAPYPLLAAALLAIAALGLSAVLRAAVGDVEADGFVELGRLMLVAKYSYPEMLGYVLFGMMAGLWIEGNNQRADLARVSGWAGATLFAGGIVLSITTGLGASWFTAAASHPGVIAYVGAVLMIFAASFRFFRLAAVGPVLRPVVRFLIVLGTLSIVAFASHEMVIPIKDVLVALGAPYAAAMAGALGLFAAIFGGAIYRLYRLYYGGGTQPVASL